MPEFDDVHLRRLDLTALLAFEALMRTRKAASAARVLRLAPSSVSHALGRLRDAFGDPLFVRRPHGLEPTHAAYALEAQVVAALNALRGAMAAPNTFDPRTSAETLRLCGGDFEFAALAPGALRAIRQAAPNLRVAMRAAQRLQALQELADGAADVALGFFQDLDDRFVATPLLEETYLTAGPADHPALRAGPPTLDAFLGADHVVTSIAGDLSGVVDATLAARGLSRRVVVAAPLFVPALEIANQLGALITAPARIVRRYAPRLGMVAHPPPLAVRPFVVSAIRHRRYLADGMRQWAIEQFAAYAGLET